MRHELIAVLAIAAFSAPAFAQVYKCTDSKGKVTFQESPCDANLGANKVRTQGSSGGFTAPVKKDDPKDAAKADARTMAAPPSAATAQQLAPSKAGQAAPQRSDAMAEERKFVSTGQQRSAVLAKLGEPDSQSVNAFYMSGNRRIVEAHTDVYEPTRGDDQTRTRIRYRGEVVELVMRELVRN